MEGLPIQGKGPSFYLWAEVFGNLIELVDEFDKLSTRCENSVVGNQLKSIDIGQSVGEIGNS